jgi:hypothetical protein
MTVGAGPRSSEARQAHGHCSDSHKFFVERLDRSVHLRR